MKTYVEVKFNRFNSIQTYNMSIYASGAKGEEPTSKTRYFSIFSDRFPNAWSNHTCSTKLLSEYLCMDIDELEQLFLRYNAMVNKDGGNLFESIQDMERMMEEVIIPHCIMLKLINKTAVVNTY